MNSLNLRRILSTSLGHISSHAAVIPVTFTLLDWWSPLPLQRKEARLR
ncbi:MAG: hypothetical protein WA183_14640 [Chthoniobacterales bacterium]